MCAIGDVQRPRPVPLQRATNRYSVSETIAAIRAGGGSHAADAFQCAFDMLATATALRRHILVLSDGIFDAPDGIPEGVRERSRPSSAPSLSTVSIGVGARQALLADLSRIGRGAAFDFNDFDAVARLVAALRYQIAGVTLR